MNTLPEYRYGAARTMVDLHGKYLQEFLIVWKEANTAEVDLPKTDHPGYVSMKALLGHVLGAPRSYMIWMTQKLELPDPKIKEIPSLEEIETEAENYLAHLILQWRTPLAEVEEDRFGDQEYIELGGSLQR